MQRNDEEAKFRRHFLHSPHVTMADEEDLDVAMEFPEFEDTNLITTAKQYSLIVRDPHRSLFLT